MPKPELQDFANFRVFDKICFFLQDLLCDSDSDFAALGSISQNRLKSEFSIHGISISALQLKYYMRIGS